MVNILVGCTGCADILQVIHLILKLKAIKIKNKAVKINVIASDETETYFQSGEIPEDVGVFTTRDICFLNHRFKSKLFNKFCSWADIFVIAPLNAPTVVKLAHGYCEDLLTSTVRIWPSKKPLLMCPAMTQEAWKQLLKNNHIFMEKHNKYILCFKNDEDVSLGAMADVSRIVTKILYILCAYK